MKEPEAMMKSWQSDRGKEMGRAVAMLDVAGPSIRLVREVVMGASAGLGRGRSVPVRGGPQGAYR